MSVAAAKAPALRHVPYWIGAFMLTPFAIWFGLWAFVFPGPKPGFDTPLPLALIAVSLPLAAWHFIVGLAAIANSMAGEDKDLDALPIARGPRWALKALPAIGLALGVLSVPYLIAAGEPLWTAPVPALLAFAVAGAQLAARRPARSAPSPGRGRGRAIGRAAARALFAVPVLGWMAREVAADPEAAAPWVAGNLVLAWILSTVVFGLAGLVIPAMLLAVAMFAAFLGFARD